MSYARWSIQDEESDKFFHCKLQPQKWKWLLVSQNGHMIADDTSFTKYSWT